PKSEAAMHVADGAGIPGRNAQQKVGHRVAAEVVAELEGAPVAAGFAAVHLVPDDVGARGPGMPAAHLADLAPITEAVFRAVDRDAGAGSQIRDHRAEGNRR